MNIIESFGENTIPLYPLTFSQKSSCYTWNHLGNLHLSDGHSLLTPVVWYGLSVIESVDFQLQVFQECKIEAFLSNVYDLIIQDRKGKRAQLVKNLTQNDLFHKLDSGGFQLMKANIKKKKIPINLTPQLVFTKQKDLGCDIAVQLDNPLSPNLSEDEIYSTIDQTIHNFITLKELNDVNDTPLSIMPVVHGYTSKMIDYCIEKYEQILGKIPIIGIGSLVPMLKTIKGTNKIGGKWTFVNNLIHVRKRLPYSMIHAFGVGGTMSYLAFYCGIDSLDSNGWIQKSGFGVIQLPGISDRFLVKKKHNRPYLIEDRYYPRVKKSINEKKIFMECNCPECQPFQRLDNQMKTWKEKVKYFDQKGTEGRLIRAIHNVSVFNEELNKIRQSIDQGSLDVFIESRLATSTYYKLFLYTKALKENRVRDAEFIRTKNSVKCRSLDLYLS